MPLEKFKLLDQAVETTTRILSPCRYVRSEFLAFDWVSGSRAGSSKKGIVVIDNKKLVIVCDVHRTALGDENVTPINH